MKIDSVDLFWLHAEFTCVTRTSKNVVSPRDQKLKRKIEQSEMSIVKLQAHTEKFTYPRDLRYVAKANIIRDEEFKTEIHSIKREAERKFIGALTKFHYRRVECANDKLRRGKSDKCRSKRDTDRA